MTADTVARPDFQKLFESVAGRCLVVAPDPPRYTVVAVSDDYARAAKTSRAELVGRGLFERPPDGTSDRGLHASLERVLATGGADAMDVQGGPGERRWRLINTPVFQASAAIEYVICRFDDVTELVLGERALEEAELRLRRANDELQWLSSQLGAAPPGGAARVMVVDDDPDTRRFACESLATEHQVATGNGLEAILEARPDVAVIADAALVAAVRSRRELDATAIVAVTTGDDREQRVALLGEGADDYLIRPFAAEELRTRVANVLSRKRAAQAEARVASLVEQAPVGIFVADLDGRYIEVNRAGCEMLGYSPGELIGASITDLIPAEDAPRLSESRELLLAGGVQVAEWNLRRKDGVWVPTEVTTKILPDGRWQGFVRDITAHKRIEDELRLAEAKASGIVSVSADAIIAVGEDQRIALFNEGAERIFGYSPSEALGAPLDMLIPERLRTRHRDHVERFARGREAARYMRGRSNPIVGLRKSGEEFPADATISRLEVGGQRILTVALRDISEQKRTENELRLLARELGALNATLEQRVAERSTEAAALSAQLHQAQKLEAVGTLASGVAHDFNNLLMGISGCADIALSRLAPDSPAHMFVDEIKKSARSGAAISKQLLAFSRRTEVIPSVLELNQAVAGTEELLRRLLAADIDISVTLDAADSRVRFAPGQLEQILVNLAVNARDAMPGGGQLAIHTRALHLDERNHRALPSGDYVALAVSDTGTGMSAETLQRIFEPFFTTKEVGKGTGLGLAMAHGIVARAGGRIDVTSELGAGTTFEVLLPRVDEPVTGNVPAPAPPAVAGAGTILVVEDDSTVRMAARFYLEQGGYRVLEASSGAEAVDCCETFLGQLHLVLSDVVLPGIGGAELGRQLERIRPGVPVIYMSAHPAEVLHQQSRLALGERSLQKPFDSDLLLSRVRDALVAGASRRSSPKTVLVVEDEPAARMAIGEHLRDLGWTVVEANDSLEALDACRAGLEPDALLTDYSLPKSTGDALARELRQRYPDIAVAYMSGYEGLEPDPPGPVLLKPLELEAISDTVAQLIERR